MSPPANNELTNLAYRVSAVEKDIQIAGKEIAEIKSQLMQKTTERENDLRFQSFENQLQVALDNIKEVKDIIKDIVSRNEKDQKDTASELKSISDSIAKIQIGALVALVLFFLGIVGTVVSFLITNTIH